MAQEVLRQMYENKKVDREWTRECKQMIVDHPMKFGLRLSCVRRQHACFK
jgi:hypothetical protein